MNKDSVYAYAQPSDVEMASTYFKQFQSAVDSNNYDQAIYYAKMIGDIVHNYNDTDSKVDVQHLQTIQKSIDLLVQNNPPFIQHVKQILNTNTNTNTKPKPQVPKPQAPKPQAPKPKPPPPQQQQQPQQQPPQQNPYIGLPPVVKPIVVKPRPLK